ncbi:MAG: hypothetical protein ACQEUZ_10695 [Pseudomonadota bacterium]
MIWFMAVPLESSAPSASPGSARRPRFLTPGSVGALWPRREVASDDPGKRPGSQLLQQVETRLEIEEQVPGPRIIVDLTVQTFSAVFTLNAS